MDRYRALPSMNGSDSFVRSDSGQSLGELARSTAFLFRRHTKAAGPLDHLTRVFDLAREFVGRLDATRMAMASRVSGPESSSWTLSRDQAVAEANREVRELLRLIQEGEAKEDQLLTGAALLVELSTELDAYERMLSSP